MHFSPELLRKHARVLVEKKVSQDRSIAAAYLRGSLLYGSPLLGGAGDIDLVFIHSAPPEVKREIIPLTPEIHFDIVHHDQRLYRDPRALRVDPWLGPTLHDAEPLHDPRHFLDYTQSGVRSNFSLPETLLARAQPLLEQARRFWLDHQLDPPQGSLPEISRLLQAIQQAANALALISGPPLPTRRLGIQFPDRANQISEDQLSASLTYLLGGRELTVSRLEGWLAPWEEALNYFYQQISPVKNHHHKSSYYLQAVKAFLENEQPEAALWPLFFTWTEAISSLPEQVNFQRDWKKACTVLGFAGKDYRSRLEIFDHFLDQCEQTFDRSTPGTGML